MIDHVSLEVADLARAARFYDALMHPLGGRRIVDSPDGIGYGRDRPELWILPASATSAGRTARTADTGRAAGRSGASTRNHAASRNLNPKLNLAPPAFAPRRSGHVAIAGAGRRAVDAAHRAGVAAGGRDGGAPAPRPSGAPSYYSGYLVDPDGAWVELVSGSRA